MHSKNIPFAMACGSVLSAPAAQLRCTLRVAVPRGCASRMWPRLRLIDALSENSSSRERRSLAGGCDVTLARRTADARPKRGSCWWLLAEVEGGQGEVKGPVGATETNRRCSGVAAHENQIAMLKAHYRAPGRLMTATQLADAVGYPSYSSANLIYGKLGFKLYGELPTKLPRNRDNAVIPTCSIAAIEDQRSSKKEEWLWKMHSYVADALSTIEGF